MISYGTVKVIKTQFPDLSYTVLTQTFGEVSPMRLLWTFMGASKLYNFYAGAGEILGGLLLLFPRTAMAGALVSAAVLSNIVALNFSYDVPVKLFSIHLLAMAIFLLLPDIKRLMNMFLLNRRVEPAESKPLFSGRPMKYTALAFRIVISILILYMPFVHAFDMQKEIAAAQKTPFRGVWSVEDFELDGTAQPPLLTDPKRWRYVILDWPGFMMIRSMADAREFMSVDFDSKKKTVTLGKPYDRKWKAILTFQQSQPDTLTLVGKMDGRMTRMTLHRRDDAAFLLTTRGFHWVNEYPYNR